MNKKIVLGFCFCIILITFAIILFFTTKSEMSVTNDISNNLYNIFPTRNKVVPYDVEYYSIESLFSKEFLEKVKRKIKARIEDNILKYLVHDLSNGLMFSKVNNNITALNNDYSDIYIQSRVPKIIKEDEQVYICSAVPGEQDYCFKQYRVEWDSPLILSPDGPHKWQFTQKIKQPP